MKFLSVLLVCIYTSIGSSQGPPTPSGHFVHVRADPFCVYDQLTSVLRISLIGTEYLGRNFSLDVRVSNFECISAIPDRRLFVDTVPVNSTRLTVEVDSSILFPGFIAYHTILSQVFDPASEATETPFDVGYNLQLNSMTRSINTNVSFAYSTVNNRWECSYFVEDGDPFDIDTITFTDI